MTGCYSIKKLTDHYGYTNFEMDSTKLLEVPIIIDGGGYYLDDEVKLAHCLGFKVNPPYLGTNLEPSYAVWHWGSICHGRFNIHPKCGSHTGRGRLCHPDVKYRGLLTVDIYYVEVSVEYDHNGHRIKYESEPILKARAQTFVWCESHVGLKRSKH